MVILDEQFNGQLPWRWPFSDFILPSTLLDILITIAKDSK